MANKKLISNIILVITLILLVYFIIKNYDEIKSLSVVAPIYLVPLALAFIFYIFTNGLLIKYLIEPFKIKLSMKESVELSILIQFYNTITPFKGGFVAKAAYLKNKYRFSYTDLISSVTGFYIINFLITSLCGLVTLIILLYRDNMFSIPIFFIFLITFMILTLVIIFARQFPKTKNKLLNRFIRVANGWNTIKNNRRIILLSLSITFAQLAVMAIGIWVGYSIFGINIGFVKALFLESIITIGSLIAITPGALGISETIQVFSASILGITSTQSLTVALLIRLVSSVIILAIGPIYSYKLVRHRTTEELKIIKKEKKKN